MQVVQLVYRETGESFDITGEALPARRKHITCVWSRRALVRILSIAALALTAGACVSTLGENPAPGAGPITPAAYGRERLTGRWGVASYHVEKDRRRTESEARAQCRQPYTIKEGPTDGVMMHVADDPNLYELRLKGDAAGKTYLGFEAPAGHPQDREILASTDNQMTMRFVDPDANQRYGTFVYVRCRA